MLERYNQLNIPKSMRVPRETLSNGATVFEEFVIVRKGQEFKAYSSHCTHLGCKINKTEGQEFVCPCHGSRYNLDGIPVKGPARKPLKELHFETLDSELVVKLEN